MPSIKGLEQRARQGWTAFRRMRAYAALDRITQSGLGDSGFLLYGLVKAAKPEVVVEIGSARGRSTCFMALALRENGQGKVYAIDPHTATAWNDDDSIHTFEILKKNLSACGVENYVEIMRSTSQEVISNWSLPIDILFIDGDHSYAGAKRDWEFFSPFVQPFGLTVFHDTLWDLRPDPRYSRPDMGVPRLVDELREQGYPVITLDKNFGVSVIQGVRNGIPLRTTSERFEVVASHD